MRVDLADALGCDVLEAVAVHNVAECCVDDCRLTICKLFEDRRLEFIERGRDLPIRFELGRVQSDCRPAGCDCGIDLSACLDRATTGKHQQVGYGRNFGLNRSKFRGTCLRGEVLAESLCKTLRSNRQCRLACLAVPQSAHDIVEIGVLDTVKDNAFTILEKLFDP
ncbi:hypothetical protein D3C80_1585440 [compost metagenome]